MKSLNLSKKRIGAMAAPFIIVLFTVVVVPLVRAKIDARKKRAEQAMSLVRERFATRLEPCTFEIDSLQDPKFAVAPDEIAIDVIPSFSAGYGLRISDRKLRSYAGNTTFLFPPPPPPPPGIAAKARASQTEAKLTFSSSINLQPRLGSRLTRLLRGEIDNAAASSRQGLDGTTYLFRYGTKCAKTWSPLLGTRAGQLVDLSDDLLLLIKSNSAAKARSEVNQVLNDLESDRLLVGG